MGNQTAEKIRINELNDQHMHILQPMNRLIRFYADAADREKLTFFYDYFSGECEYLKVVLDYLKNPTEDNDDDSNN